MKTILRRQLPSAITFAGLFFALSSIVLSLHGKLIAAALCILAGNIMDALDGAAARRLGVSSAFGLQLDSLVDVITFGVAPAILVHQYMQPSGLLAVLMWAICIVYVCGGVFRLARFNLLPPKENSRQDILGLTISTSGGILALAVLSNVHGGYLLPVFVFPLLMVGLALLMVSRIRYPGIGTLVQRRRLALAVLIVVAVLLLLLPPPPVLLLVWAMYVFFGLGRAIYRLVPLGART